ncbi:MAG: membrane protein insertion efficiency factor YidD [Patescibacteria group bacterium]|nr:membrane protein insertion efficiency factor YidD [Patescibacteria group bacterium]
MDKIRLNIKRILLKVIRFYQNNFSPDHSIYSKKHSHGYCRFYPTCSEYSYRAINKYGPGKGLLKALWRILRCHPFSKGGYDPV